MKNEDLIPPLDGRLGPAHWLPENHTAEMADAVVSRALRAERARSRAHRFALAAGIALLLGVAATGLAMVTLRARPTTPAAPRSTPHVGKAHQRESLVPEPPPAAEPDPGVTSATPALVPSPPEETQPVRLPTASHPDNPRALLQRANGLRTQRRWREAATAYERVASELPASDEAYSALVAAAALSGEHLGRPRKALHLYSQALRLRPEGPLGHEVLWGSISAQRALGNVAAESVLLRSFLERYPDSLFRGQAERRLKEIAIP